MKNGHSRHGAEFSGKFRKRLVDRSNLINGWKDLRNAQCSDFSPGQNNFEKSLLNIQVDQKNGGPNTLSTQSYNRKLRVRSTLPAISNKYVFARTYNSILNIGCNYQKILLKSVHKMFTSNVHIIAHAFRKITYITCNFVT